MRRVIFNKFIRKNNIYFIYYIWFFSNSIVSWSDESFSGNSTTNQEIRNSITRLGNFIEKWETSIFDINSENFISHKTYLKQISNDTLHQKIHILIAIKSDAILPNNWNEAHNLSKHSSRSIKYTTRENFRRKKWTDVNFRINYSARRKTNVCIEIPGCP